MCASSNGESSGTLWIDPHLLDIKKACSSVLHSVVSVLHYFKFTFSREKRSAKLGDTWRFEKRNKLGLLPEGGYKPYSSKQKFWFDQN